MKLFFSLNFSSDSNQPIYWFYFSGCIKQGYSVENFITAYKESQLNRDSYFLICNVFSVSKGNLFDVYVTKQ